MNELQRRLGPRGLVVLGFPCNQFGHQVRGAGGRATRAGRPRPASLGRLSWLDLRSAPRLRKKAKEPGDSSPNPLFAAGRFPSSRPRVSAALPSRRKTPKTKRS